MDAGLDREQVRAQLQVVEPGERPRPAGNRACETQEKLGCRRIGMDPFRFHRDIPTVEALADLPSGALPGQTAPSAVEGAKRGDARAIRRHQLGHRAPPLRDHDLAAVSVELRDRLPEAVAEGVVVVCRRRRAEQGLERRRRVDDDLLLDQLRDLLRLED